MKHTPSNRKLPLEQLARRFYRNELKDELTYRYLARHSRDPQLKQLLERIADIEHGHAGFWGEILQQQQLELPKPPTGGLRLWLLGLLMRLVNPMLVISSLELGESSAYEQYFLLYREGALDETTRERLRDIIIDELEHESAFHEARSRSGFDNIRDFILGMNDGLVEILGAVTGLSAAYSGNPLVVAVSGMVVGVAGALSMGIGAFVSVRSQRQINEARRQRSEILFSVSPERAATEFERKLQESGIPESVRREVTEKLAEEGDALAQLLAQPSDENEWRSALFTGAAYLFGVLFPVLPYFLADQASHALLGSFFFAGLALASVGGLVAIVSGIPLGGKIREMLFSGFSAAGLAYLFGQLMKLWFGVEI